MQGLVRSPSLRAVSVAAFLASLALACSSSGIRKAGGTGGSAGTGGVVSAAGQSTSESAGGGQGHSGGSQFPGSGGVNAGGATGGSTVSPDGGVLPVDAAPIQGGPLQPAEAERLQRLGAGMGCDSVTKQDLLLVQRGMLSPDEVDHGWAYLAVEKLAHCQGLLDRAFIDAVFSHMLAAAGGTNLELARFAVRGLGEVSAYTDLLTVNQVSQAFGLAVTSLASGDLEIRGRGLGLLGELLRQLDAGQMHEAFRLLFAEFDAWDKSYSGTWGEFTRKVVDLGSTPELRFQSGALNVFLQSCQYVQDPKQAATAYPVVASALKQGKLGALALTSVAGLAGKLSEPERGQAVDLIIAGLSNSSSWYDLGSGRRIPANYANDAVSMIEIWLNRDQLQRALDAIALQAGHADYAEVFTSTVDRLKKRLAELSSDAGG